jgi:hypothetical protein
MASIAMNERREFCSTLWLHIEFWVLVISIALFGVVLIQTQMYKSSTFIIIYRQREESEDARP